MNNKKIIYLDLDETLLNSKKEISAKNHKALQDVLNAGYYIAITTGRPIEGANRIVERFGLTDKGCYLLSFHGSALYDCYTKEVLMTNAMDSNKVVEFMEALEEREIYTQAFGQRCIFSMHECEELLEYNRVTHEPYEIITSYNQLKDEKLLKFMALDYENHERLVSFQKEYEEKEKGYFNSFFSCREFLEYCKEGSNKGSGLKFLAQYLDVDITNTIAVGDERNDIPMIIEAGIGCAMCNGREEAKEVADYITQNDNNHDGVAEVIYKFMLNDMKKTD